MALDWGSEFYRQVKSNTLPLLKFKNAESIAYFINESFQCELVSAREKNAFSRKSQGMPTALSLGRSTEVPEDDLNDLVSLVFTAVTIDQSNCVPKRMTRKTQTSIVGNIVNKKRQKEGKHEISDISLF